MLKVQYGIATTTQNLDNGKRCMPNYAAIVYSRDCCACRHDRIEAQRAEVEQRRLQLSTTLEGQIADPYCTAGERRTAAGLLATAVNKPWAHQKLLDAHSAQLRQQQDSLCKPQNTSTHPSDVSVGFSSKVVGALLQVIGLVG